MILKGKLFLSISISICIFICILCGVYFYLPYYLEKNLLPRLAVSCGFENSACEVRKFSLNRLDLASLKWGDPEKPTLFLDSVRVDYSLPGLFKQHINKIVISGIEIRAEYNNGRLTIPGLDFEKVFKSAPKENQERENSSRALPVSFGEFEIRNAAIILKSGAEDFKIPFSIKVTPLPTKENQPASGYDMHAWLYPNLTNLLPGSKIASQIDVHTVFDFNMNDAGLTLNLSDMNIEYNGLQIQNAPGNVPLTIEVTKKHGVIRGNFSRFCITSPFPVEISMDRHTDCILRISQEGMDIQGIINLNLNKELVNSGSRSRLKLANSESLPLKFKGKKHGDFWHFSVNSSGLLKPLQFHGQTESVIFHPKNFSMYGKGKDSSGDVRFAGKMSHIEYNSGSMHLDIPNFWIYGNSPIDSSRHPAIRAFAKVSDAHFSTGGLHARKIHAKIPFQWPYSSIEMGKVKFRNDEKMYFTIDELKYYDMDLGAISATPYQDGLNMLFVGQYSGLLPDFSLNFSGRAGINDDYSLTSKVDFKAAKPEKTVKIGLEKFSSQLFGTYFEGNLDINGGFNMTGRTITSSGLIALHNSKIEAPEKKMVVEGIDVDLNMQDLYNFRSEPVQILTFKRFAWGDIEMVDGEMDFRIESSASFSLEKCSFSWCGGHVYTHGLHLKSGTRDLDLILYCDRLKLATILKQFNLASAEGEGAVNGRIPITFKDGKIKIHDGFLYSTPGEGGTIHFRTDTLVTGVSDPQQNIQMQITREALKNFNYDWVKLSLQSYGGDLVILMQMDGRPADLLPFGFQKNVGLTKVDGEPRAHFQGIRFNINFRLPLDKMLYYGSGIGDLLHHE